MSLRRASIALFFVLGMGSAATAAPRTLGRVTGSALRLSPSPESPEQATYRDKWLGRMRSDWGGVVNPSGKVRRVFYPFGGSDVSSVLQMFEGPHGHPDDILITDIQRFGSPTQIARGHQQLTLKNAYFKDKRTHAYSWYHTIGGLGRSVGLGTSLLWELEQLGARNVVVSYLDERGRVVPPAGEPTVDTRGPVKFIVESFTIDPAERQIARIRFTLDGKRHTLTYVQQNMLDGSARPMLLDDFLGRGVDAIFEKASAFSLDSAAYRELRKSTIGRLAPGHGVLVSDYWMDEKKVSEFSLRVRGEVPAYGWQNSNARPGEHARTLSFYTAER